MKSTRLFIVDTPGMFDPDSVLAERALQIQQALEECPEPHAFLIVFKADSLGKDTDVFTIEMMRLIFGEECLKHAIVVVSNGGKFKTDVDFETAWKDSDKMKAIVKLCHGHIARIENKDLAPQVRRDMATKIFALIDRVSRMGHYAYKNKNLPYHKRMLEQHLKYCDADTSIPKQIEEMKKFLAENAPATRDNIEYEVLD